MRIAGIALLAAVSLAAARPASRSRPGGTRGSSSPATGAAQRAPAFGNRRGNRSRTARQHYGAVRAGALRGNRPEPKRSGRQYDHCHFYKMGLAADREDIEWTKNSDNSCISTA